MRQVRYISVYSIIRQVYRDLGVDDINESDAIEWAADAVEQMSIKQNYIINTAFLDIENYHCELPANVTKVLQVAKHGKCEKLPKFPQTIIMEVDSDPCGCNTIDVQCGCKTVKKHNPHLQFCSSFVRNFGMVFNINTFRNDCRRWYEVEPTGNNYFNSGVCNGGEHTDALQYRIENGNLLVSFENGVVAVSYVTPMFDEDGMPMIPDDVSAREAVSKYIAMKIMARQWYKGREGFQDKMMKAEQDWHWYCKQYKSKMKMLEADDYRKLMRQELRMFPVFTPDHYGSINVDFEAVDCDIHEEYINPYDYKAGPILFFHRDAFPNEGCMNKLYVDIDNNDIYRWDGFQYIKLSDVTIDQLNTIITEIDDNWQ